MLCKLNNTMRVKNKIKSKTTKEKYLWNVMLFKKYNEYLILKYRQAFSISFHITTIFDCLLLLDKLD